MKQVNKITLFYDDGTFQDIIVPTQFLALPTVFIGNQLLQEYGAVTVKPYPATNPDELESEVTSTAWIPKDSAAEKKAARAYIRANWPFPK